MPYTRLSSKGQVVLPKAVREALGLKAGEGPFGLLDRLHPVQVADGVGRHAPGEAADPGPGGLWHPAEEPF